jgi:hypothetical protein
MLVSHAMQSLGSKALRFLQVVRSFSRAGRREARGTGLGFENVNFVSDVRGEVQCALSLTG